MTGVGAGPASAILLVTHGTDGDVLPFVRLGRLLRARGHAVTLLTHAPYRSAAETAGLSFVPIDTPAAYDRYLADSALLPDGRGTLTWADFYRRNGLFDQLAVECHALAGRVVPGRTIVAGRHTSALSALMLKELLGVPAAWIAVAPIQPMALGVARHLHQHALADGIGEVRAALGLAPVTDWRSWFSSADLRLGLWPAWFDESGPRTRLHHTGFPYPDQPAGAGAPPPEVADLLRGPERPVLVTGGTGRMLHPRFYQAALDGCRRAGLPALLVVPHADLVPGPLPPDDGTGVGAPATPGVHRFARLPFPAVMPEVAAVLHHGGIGTLTRALASGTPQVILAHGADRPDNAARLAHAGLARWLPEPAWTPDRVARALTTAIRDGRPVPQDTTDGLTTAAEHLESLLADHPPADHRRTLAGLPLEQRRALVVRLRRRRAERSAS